MVVTSIASGIKSWQSLFTCSPSMCHSCNIVCWHSSQWTWGQDRHRRARGWAVVHYLVRQRHMHTENSWLFWCQLTPVVVVQKWLSDEFVVWYSVCVCVLVIHVKSALTPGYTPTLCGVTVQMRISPKRGWVFFAISAATCVQKT